MAIILNTQFPGSNVNPIGGIWTTISGLSAIQRVSNTAQATTANTQNAVADTTNTYPNDHYCIVVTPVSAVPVAGETITAMVRCTAATPIYIGFNIQHSVTGASLIWHNGASGGTIASFNLTIAANLAGDSIELDAQGQLYTCWHTPISTGIRYSASASTDGSSHATAGTAGFRINPLGNAFTTVPISQVITGNFLSVNNAEQMMMGVG